MMNINPQMVNMVQQMMNKYGGRENTLRQMRQQAGNNPVLNNALDLFEKGDYDGLNRVGNNLFKERGFNPMNMFNNRR